MARREYKGAAAPCRLSAIIDADDTTILLTGDTDDWPTGAVAPFYVEIDREVNGSAEKILVNTRTGNTLHVSGSGNRGVDGTTAVPHEANAVVEHVIDAGTIDEANAHVNDDARDDHSQYMTISRHDTTARHLLGTSVPAGSPGTSSPGDTGSGGVSTSAARADHRHARGDSYGVVGSMQAEAIGSTAAAGTSPSTARIDHRHAMPAAGTPGASAPGDTASAGSATTVALSDHRHAREAGPGALSWTGNATGDQTVGLGAETTVLTVPLSSLTTARILTLGATFEVRESAGDLNFAGYINIKVDGVVPLGGTVRFHSHGKGGMVTAVVPCVLSSQAAGAHTVTVTATNDGSSGAAIWVSMVQANIGAIGG